MADLWITDCLGNSYSNVFPSRSLDSTTDQCYYNFDGSKFKPDTAISVENLPDVVLQPEFRQELDTQFEVSKTSNIDFCNDTHFQNHVAIFSKLVFDGK